MKPLILIVATVALAGCGASSNGTATVSEHKANTQIQQLANCNPASPSAACKKALNAPNPPTVTRCGDGLSTTSSCVFARNVLRAYRAAERIYGAAPTGMRVTGTSVACTGAAAAWRCENRTNRAVTVSYARP